LNDSSPHATNKACVELIEVVVEAAVTKALPGGPASIVLRGRPVKAATCVKITDDAIIQIEDI